MSTIRLPSGIPIPEFPRLIQTPPLGIPNVQEPTNISQETTEGVTYAAAPVPYDEVMAVRQDFIALERQHGALIADDFDG